MRRHGLALAIAVITVIVLVGVASAEPAGTVKTFTGCLVAGDGVIVKVKEGASPKSSCSGGQTLARLSGGDITKISVTGALTLPDGPGTGESGDVTIGLKPEFTLPGNCATGRVAKWNGSTWACGVDNDTTYTAGTGLDLSGGAFGIESAYRLPGKACSTAGEFATGFDSNGAIGCAAPPAPSGVEVWQKTAATGDSIALPNGEGVDLVSMPLPAGTFLITAVATVRDESGVGDDQVSASCRLRNGAFAALPVNAGYIDIGEGQGLPGAAVVVHGLLSLASSDTVRFTCFGEGSSNRAADVTLTAVKVGTVHLQ
jgi:hypothetical protein